MPLVFASNDRVLAASGIARSTSCACDELGGHVAAAFASSAAPPIVFAALPFDLQQRAQLVAPAALTGWPAASGGPGSHGAARLLMSEPPPAAYMDAVARALAEMTPHGDLQKVVLSRRVTYEFDADINLAALVNRLRRDPHVTTFCFPLRPAGREAPAWIVGASPELLIAKNGAQVVSAPLAGSARRVPDVAADQAAAAGLERSDKDQREHAMVVEWIADRLTPFCKRLSVPARPSMMSTEAMWHLGTTITGELVDRDIASVELAAALHPTPAVCGAPYEAAMSAIRRLEPFDRGCYGGVVGWTEANGDGQWMVAIRCAEISGRTARLFAGAGIVPGSTPAAELDETSAKLATLLNALGILESGVERPAP